jgi:hypothetical protein
VYVSLVKFLQFWLASSSFYVLVCMYTFKFFFMHTLGKSYDRVDRFHSYSWSKPTWFTLVRSTSHSPYSIDLSYMRQSPNCRCLTPNITCKWCSPSSDIIFQVVFWL